ncbi:MAG TPA: ribulose-phosphate 3-epimerase [Tenuifilaceae bacterium]|nr:ribulose-phosphate 3-epimerase [Tenuifilaceae bacterium]
MEKLVAPSMLSADFAKLSCDIEMVNKSKADWFHLDIMDGVFVPNISFGFPVVEHIKKEAKKPLDVHLMIVDPDRYIDRFKQAGADWLTVHYEACTHLHRTLSEIRNQGMKAGVALNPHTPVESLTDILEMADMVLIMSVNPGFGGQKFIANTYSKINRLRKMIESRGLATLIQVDGGVDTTNAAELYKAGVNVLVAGSSVFKSDNPLATIEALKNA